VQRREALRADIADSGGATTVVVVGSAEYGALLSPAPEPQSYDR